MILIEPLIARFLDDVLENIPQPCVMIKKLNHGTFVHTKVTLHPNEALSNYGDLIDTYGAAKTSVASVQLPEGVTLPN